MRFVLVFLLCHQVGHDSNLASAVINAGTSLQLAIFSSQGCCWELAIAKNALEGFHKRYCLWWNLRTSCLSSGQLIVLTRIPCDLSSLTPALRCLWQACYQCLMGESEWGGKWQQQPHYWQLGKCWDGRGTLAFAEIWFFLYHPISWSAPHCCHLPQEIPVLPLRPFLGSPQRDFKHFPDLSGILQAEQLLSFILLLTWSSILRRSPLM